MQSFTTREIQQITGIRLSLAQADALNTYRSDSEIRGSAATLGRLAQLGLVTLNMSGAFLTDAGRMARRRLNDACEFGVTAARLAFADQIDASEAHEVLRNLTDSEAEIAILKARQSHTAQEAR